MSLIVVARFVMAIPLEKISVDKVSVLFRFKIKGTVL